MMNQCDHPRDFTLHSAGRPTLKEASTFGDGLALPEEFLDSDHERDDADNDRGSSGVSPMVAAR